jgi:hypothetical protein
VLDLMTVDGILVKVILAVHCKLKEEMEITFWPES